MEWDESELRADATQQDPSDQGPAGSGYLLHMTESHCRDEIAPQL